MDIQIKFLEDCDPQDGTGKIFAAGSVKRLNPASARHWTRRGKAVEITNKEIKDLKKAKEKTDAETKEKEAEKAKKAAEKKAKKEAEEKKKAAAKK